MYGDKKKINGTAKHLINTTELSDITLKWTGKRPKKKHYLELLGKLSTYTDTFEKNRLIEVQKKTLGVEKKEQEGTES